MTAGSQRKASRPLMVQIVRGIVSHGSTRRRVMGGLVIMASALLAAGATFGAPWLSERPILFLLHWLAVAWLTCTALLMAVFDMLLVRRAARAAHTRLRRELLDSQPPGQLQDQNEIQ